ncbi:Serine/threonine protein phosphatase 2A 59 kDa regulatory subunit B' eta isoform, partial [Reticulomyxa filosa]
DENQQLARVTKRQCLIELVEYVTQSKQVFNEEVMPYVIEMLSKNLFRSLPPPLYADFDPEEDEPNFNSAWPHLQFVYEFFHRFVMTADVNLLRKYLNKKFLLHAMDLFNSEDPRERDYLKMILHRIYGRCMPYRLFIRKAINNVLLCVIYESQRHNGISELLEILGSIINGFALPLKEEHIHFLQSILIPLHKAPTLPQFHQQLAYCITQFVQKDNTLASCVLSGILKYWPITSCQKETLFLNEMEEILELTPNAQIEKVMVCMCVPLDDEGSSPFFFFFCTFCFVYACIYILSHNLYMD